MSASAEALSLDESRFLDFDPFEEKVRQGWEEYSVEWAGRPAFYSHVRGAPAAVLIRHADMRELYIRQSKNFQSTPVIDVPPDASNVFLTYPNLSRLDGDEHRRVRGAMQPAFGKDGVGAHQEQIDRVVNELLDEIAARGEEFDAARDFSRLLMPRVILREMFGLDEEQAAICMQMHDLFPTVFALGGQSAEFIEARAVAWGVLEEVVSDRKQKPNDDFIGRMAVAETEGVLSHNEVIGNLFSVCIAAIQSTGDSMAHLLIGKCRFPDQFAQVREDLDLVPSAVEESLRLWNAEYMSFPRYALVDTEVGGLSIPRGLVVFPFVAAGNRDPEKYPNPTQFDVHRNPTHHLAFAQGAHHCIGAILARRALASGLTAFMRRYPNFQLADENFKPSYIGPQGQLTQESVPMLLGPTA
jgi:cytochrome P450